MVCSVKKKHRDNFTFNLLFTRDLIADSASALVYNGLYFRCIFLIICMYFCNISIEVLKIRLLESHLIVSVALSSFVVILHNR